MRHYVSSIKLFRDWKTPDYWDQKARIYFPLSFTIFNILYWAYVIYKRWTEGFDIK